MMNTSIKADVIKASQQAYKSGYDPSLMNEDLQLAQEQAKSFVMMLLMKARNCSMQLCV